jgi:hypothetical protein
MPRTITLMEQDGNSPALFWTTKLIGSAHKDGSLSIWAVEESAFGRVTHTVATRVAAADEIIPALLSLSELCELEIGYDEIAGTVGSRIAELDAHIADAVRHAAAELMQGVGTLRQAA